MLKYFLSLKAYYFLPILKEVKTFLGPLKVLYALDSAPTMLNG